MYNLLHVYALKKNFIQQEKVLREFCISDLENEVTYFLGLDLNVLTLKKNLHENRSNFQDF